MKTIPPRLQNRHLWMAFFLFIAVCYLALLDMRPLATPSEGRYAEIPREMLATGDWMTPRLNGLLYFEKPPLYYWMAATSMAVFGESVGALRLVPVLCALLLCWFCYDTAHRIYDIAIARTATAILASSALFFAMSRSLLTDMVFSAMCSIAILLFLQLRHIKPGRTFLARYMGAAAAIAFAVLAKGLIGIVIPGLVIGVWCLWTREWKLIFNRYLPWGILALLAIASPWHIYMALHHAEFLDFYFIREHFTRYLTTEHHRYQPFWFFIPVAFFGLMPWFILAPQATRRLVKQWRWKKPGTDMFMAIWVLLPLAFFSASSSKLVPYIIPIFPPLAILIARYWNDCDKIQSHRAALCFCGLMIFLAATAAIAILLPNFFGKLTDELQSANSALIVIYLACAAGAITAFLWRNNSNRIFVIIITSAMIIYLPLDNLAGKLDNKSIKPIADAISPQLSGQPYRVASYFFYPQDLPFYLRQPIVIVGWKGELEFATTVEDTSRVIMEDAQFWQAWQERKIDFVIMQKSAFDQLDAGKKHLLLVWAENAQYVAAKNRAH